MKNLLKQFAVYQALVGTTAIIGGYGLVTTNGLGMPLSFLHDSLFTSYFLPGVILLTIVGGSYMVSSLSIATDQPYKYEASAISGFALLIWIFTEMYIIRQSHWLHIVYFGIGVTTLVFTMLLLKYTHEASP
jgi:hypothetical protein